jgi:glycerol-3-phosphate acyltransferase PlsY
VVGFPCLLAIIAITFLLGSLPSGVIVGKAFYHTDIRQQGSGNIGTTNAMRAMGKAGGSAVFVMDFLKGLLAGFVGVWLFDAMAGSGAFGVEECKAFAFIGCALGHIFSPWLGFRGGKGIAVSVGCLFVTFGPAGALLELGVFIVLVLVTRYVSVGSIAAAVLCMPLSACCFWGHPLAVAVCWIVALAVIWAHRENISRLRNGCENRIGDKGKSAA